MTAVVDSRRTRTVIDQGTRLPPSAPPLRLIAACRAVHNIILKTHLKQSQFV
jgi:hypothetical protein